MSRHIEQRDGRVIETIEDMEECLFKWNDLCCDDRADDFAYSPGEHCKSCHFFTKEDGIVNRK